MTNCRHEKKHGSHFQAHRHCSRRRHALVHPDNNFRMWQQSYTRASMHLVSC